MGRPDERVVLVYDSACGDCAGIAGRVGQILGRPVTTRSCRDPALGTEHPQLRERLRAGPCRRPLLLVTGPDGRVRVVAGLRLWWSAAAMVRASAWPAAAMLAGTVLSTQLRHRLSGRPSLHRPH